MKMRPFKVSDPKPQVEPALDQGQIVQAALGLLDEVGFDSLTMRSLAKKLDIQAASLYWHVRGKQHLLSLMAEEICAPMGEPDRTLPWRNQLEVLANEYRRVLLAHRDAARVLARSGAPSGPNRLRLTEIVLRTLLDAGFGHKDAAYAGFLLNDYVTTFVLEETQDANAEAESAADSGVQNWVKALPPNDYPSIVALADYLMELDVDERFQFGIEILRNGLETHLARRKA
ncbi:MAG: TetR/AcrR family transcriptional regulator C-terminal domain-containing protein [Chloroflexi bacterium]|nr:TetR/AcrR family transcriptional regulator C-terminal domain-containing protein [Chloroflexota bacterium]MCI0576550.1 TetR/AcrR family transcriptional regulator C-terminal domain-containing protein [Chloroflexota bacterium]MCI0646681.1 TetR/AcrR family transcriptional regulator C-terminal domain-containing protein [Chloroflexota bacterium]MCI0727532.1 TetR/AcrR family transcriptional regulator C-terminal domain-containing protein [Chloroflexota bacterium]